MTTYRYRQTPLKPREVQFATSTRYVAIELVCRERGVVERRVTMWDGVEIHDVHQAANPYPSHGADRKSVNKRYRGSDV